MVLSKIFLTCHFISVCKTSLSCLLNHPSKRCKLSLPLSSFVTNEGGAVIRTSERAAKVQATHKIHSIASEINSSESEFHGSRQRSKAKDEEWSEPEYHGLRQKSRQLKSQDLPEGKRTHQSNAWGSRKRPEMDSKDEVECLDASGQVGDSGNWQSERDQVGLLLLSRHSH